MVDSNFTNYQFENYDVEGLKLKINFLEHDSIKIKTHEKINIPIENNVKVSFEPLLFGIDMNWKINKRAIPEMMLYINLLYFFSRSKSSKHKIIQNIQIDIIANM